MRRKILLIALITVSALSGLPPAHAGLTPEQRTRDAQQLIDLFIHRYGPLAWKQENLQIDFTQMSNTLLQKAGTVATDLDFYEALKEFAGGFQDAHVGILLPSSYLAKLGFSVSAFGRDYLITDIDRKILDEHKFPFAAGDTVVRFDGTAVDTVALQLARYRQMGQRQANRRRGAQYLTWRPQKTFPHIPDGAATIDIRSRRDGQVRSITLPWQHTGTPFADFRERSISKALAAVATPPLPPVSYFQEAPLFANWPELVERSTTPFLSGIIVLPDLRIGFLRLQDWDPADDRERQARLDFLQAEIPYLNEHTDALIIDQTNNPGGFICFGEKVAGFFLQQPVKELQFRVKPTRTWTLRWETDLQDDTLTAAERKLIEAQSATLHRNAADGLSLSDPLPLCNYDSMVNPNTIDGPDGKPRLNTYQRPVILLVDSASCSTGDMFPALLQDAGAATIFGERTVGCGGSVVTDEYLGYSDIEARITLSLAMRNTTVVSDSGIPTPYIENVGVHPDVPYAVSGADYLDNGAKYRATVEATIRKLVQKNANVR